MEVEKYRARWEWEKGKIDKQIQAEEVRLLASA